jgi:hypothetical protein
LTPEAGKIDSLDKKYFTLVCVSRFLEQGRESPLHLSLAFPQREYQSSW